MTPFERERAKRAAQAKLLAMRERAARLRRRVLAIAAIGFAVLWIAVFAQMITGHDPALGPVAATVHSADQESVASDPERRVQQVATREESDEEGYGKAVRIEAERVEAEAIEAEELEAQAAAEAEAVELEAAATGQS